MTKRTKAYLILAAALGVGALVVRVFFWPKHKPVREIRFDIPTDDVTAEDFIIKSESINGKD